MEEVEDRFPACDKVYEDFSKCISAKYQFSYIRRTGLMDNCGYSFILLFQLGYILLIFKYCRDYFSDVLSCYASKALSNEEEKKVTFI
jgi:hypothetical protein